MFLKSHILIGVLLTFTNISWCTASYVIERKSTSKVCEDQYAHVSCSCGHISITSATYGTSPPNPCTSTNRRCSTPVANVVGLHCNNRKTCSPKASNDWYRDPCGGTTKYLHVTYNCIGDLPKPDDCVEVRCHSLNTVWCTKCLDNQLFKLINGKCHPTTTPTISSCLTKAVAADNTEVSSSNDGSSACSLQSNMYGRFNVNTFTLDINAFYKVSIDPKYAKPAYVKNFIFGITDVEIQLKKVPLRGSNQTFHREVLKRDTGTADIVENFAMKRTINANENLLNGDKICVLFQIKGGGYLESMNTETHSARNVSYNKTHTDKELCYIYDKLSPRHCSEYTPCGKEPLHLCKRLTTSKRIKVSFGNWEDPNPSNVHRDLASGIKHYEINVYEVKESTSTELMRDTTSKKQYKVNNTISSIEIDLPERDIPMLYAILLEVTDNADNVKQARRFVLFDNSSFITKNESAPLLVQSASAKTKYSWQINHGEMCFSWKNHFYNNEYKRNNPFRSIKPELSGAIQGTYEQTSGLLPINGTKNINGLTGFLFYLTRNQKETVQQGRVSNFMTEALCLHSNMSDGDTFDLNIQARDIMNHTLNDTVSVHIDSSVPEITDIWLEHNGHQNLFVHHSTDLSLMTIQFKAFDIHSGIREIQWAFGIYENKTVLTHNNIGVLAADKHENECANRTDFLCYCPRVGKCSYTTYNATLTKLENKIGNHNRRYFFTVKAINNAYLTTVEHTDILVDESPPEVGVVLEGSIGSPDIDFTSVEEIIVNWHGFIDHESGIKLYRVALARHCLPDLNDRKAEKYEKYIVTETPHDALKLTFPDGEGQYFVTVIAFNNAMSPSKAVCSDGIVYDKSIPNVRNINMKHTQTAKSVGCYNAQPWLINEQARKIKLLSKDCARICENYTSDEIVSVLPEARGNSIDGEAISSFWCKNLPRYRNNIIYTSSDLFELSWEIADNRSQISQVFIGFGRDASYIDSPDVMDYSPVHLMTKYTQRHPGLIGMENIFVFLKVVNKAGLERRRWYGPLLADETSPVCPSTLQPFIDSHGNYVVRWTNRTFQETEQTEEIGKIMFRFGIADKFITPFLEWTIHEHGSNCGKDHRCIKYPIIKLHNFDSISGLGFYVQMDVFNYAGHFCTVKSDSIRLPSLFPPRKGIVKDIDLTSQQLHDDIDVTFNSSYFCYEWNGFDHHENVTIKAGLGSHPAQDDDISFHPIKFDKEKRICERFNGSKDRKYYVTLKANCSGGTTYASSDGFTVLSADDFTSGLHIYHGDACDQDETIVNIHVVREKSDIIGIHVMGKLQAGTTYSLLSRNSVDVDFDNRTADIHVKKKFIKNSYNIISFIPLNEMNRISLNFKYNILDKLVDTNDFILRKCDPQLKVRTSKRSIPIWWSLPTQFQPFITHFRIGICKTDNDKCEKDILFTSSGKEYSTTFHGDFSGGVYKAAVQPCIAMECLQTVWSNEIELQELNNYQLDIQARGTDEETCLKIYLEIDKYHYMATNGSSLFAFGYRWGVFKTKPWQNMISGWNVFTDDENTTTFYVSKCLELPVYFHKQLFVCVEAFCETGIIKSCTPLNMKSDPNVYDKTILYDLKMSKTSLDFLEKFKDSTNIGVNLIDLHNMEVDFAECDVKIGGILLGQTGSDIEWFLMKEKSIPNDCDSHPSCLMVKKASSGFVNFDNSPFQEYGVYFICAKTAATDTDISLSVCSNGFLVDDNHPMKGNVVIDSNNGFVSDGSQLTVQWYGFTGNQKATDLGYPSDIAFYQYALGTHPGFDDVVPFSDAGLSVIKTSRHLQLTNGQAYYATVKAFNHLNKSAEAYSLPVIYDNTPPMIGSVDVRIDGQTRIVSADRFVVEWAGIIDHESGIHKIEIGIGSTNTSTDIIAFAEFQNFAEIDNDGFQDGHRYYVIVKATNGAGLFSHKSSNAVIVDASPPETGHVMDGLIKHDSNKADIDFQIETTSISCSWYGFHDTHSDISFYKVGLGTTPGDDDVIPFTFVGLAASKTWKSSFSQGIKYYSTVSACNKAGLCVAKFSNGVLIDNSAPVPGRVLAGSQAEHSRYLSHTKTLHSSWVGFQDPHSGVEYFDACVGTTTMSCDVMQRWNVSLASSFVKTNLNMLTGQNYFVTIRACNNVKLCSQQSSQSFVIDNTPPEVITKPYIQSIHMTYSGSRIILSDPSFFKVKWKFLDNESPIIRTSIQMKSTINSFVPVDNMDLTDGNEVVVSLKEPDLLRNGDVYVIRVTACNAASLCYTAVSDNILIDSTPPLLGLFMPPLTYEFKNNLTTFGVRWNGFVDPESDIQIYHLSIGTVYNGNEYVENALILPNSSDIIHSQQTYISINANAELPNNVVITLWATNNAGLKSDPARVTTDVLPSNRGKGELIIRTHSCQINYCNNDCTCSVIGKKCSDQGMPCSESKSPYNSTLTVNLISDHASHSIGSSKCLSAEWVYHKSVLRYEYSYGISKGKVGEGIIDLNAKHPWIDAGTQLNGSDCLGSKINLMHESYYVAYVRAWLSATNYVVSESHPVIVDHTAPIVHKKHFIIDMKESGQDDIDFLDSQSLMLASWDDVFDDPESGIDHFMVSLGTSPSFDDIVHWTNIGLSTRIQWKNISFEPGVKYFANVRAINALGMTSEMSSDGFMLDDTPTTTGVVYNTGYHKDVLYQSGSDKVQFSWHGFSDQHSYLNTYKVDFVLNEVNNSAKYIDNGMKNVVSFNGKLNHQDNIYAMVRAVDKAGHEGFPVKSQPIVIDNTPPESIKCDLFEDAFVRSVVPEQSMFTWTYNISANRNELLKIRITVKDTGVQFHANFRMNGMNMILPFVVGADGSSVLQHYYLSRVKGISKMSVQLYDIKPGTNITTVLSKCVNSTRNSAEVGHVVVQQLSKYSASVCVLAIDPESGIKRVSIGAGSVFDGLEIQPMKSISSGLHDIIHGNFTHGIILYIKAEVENHAGLKSIFRAKPITIDHTEPVIRNVTSSIHYKVVSNETMVMLSSNWTVKDNESGIKYCEHCIGLSESTCDVIDWETASTETSYISVLFKVAHGSRLFGRVRCVNSVEFVGYANSRPHIVSYLQPSVKDPEIRLITDTNRGPLNQKTTSVIAWWNELDDISGITTYKALVENGSSVLWNWEDIGNKNFLLISDIGQPDKMFYNVKVKGVNVGTQVSCIMNGSIWLDKTKPQLTGGSVSIQVNSKTEVTITWRYVFEDEPKPRSYEVSVGSSDGSTDILMPTMTSHTEAKVFVPEKVNQLFVVVLATTESDISQAYRETISLH